MTPRQKRMATVAAIIAGVGIATAFALQAFQQNLLYYYSPTQILAGEAPDSRTFRVGGLVAGRQRAGAPGSLKVRFALTDFANTVAVDLHRRAAGPVPRGSGHHRARQVEGSEGEFVADEVLAKHDENYMPPEVKDGLQPDRTTRRQDTEQH